MSARHPRRRLHGYALGGDTFAGGPQRVSQADVATAWRAVGTSLPLQYFIGTAQHESGYAVNDVNLNDQPAETPPNSYGIYQISPSEAAGAGYSYNDALDLQKATKILARVAEGRASQLRPYLGLPADGSGDVPELAAWLAYAHNKGVGAAAAAIQSYGSWASYAAANPGAAITAYGNDTIPDVWAGSPGSSGGWLLAAALLGAAVWLA